MNIFAVLSSGSSGVLLDYLDWELWLVGDPLQCKSATWSNKVVVTFEQKLKGTVPQNFYLKKVVMLVV